MKFGVRLPNSGPLAKPKNITRVAEEAERLGFDSVWVHDHILWGTEQHKTHLSAGSAEALNDSQTPNFYESITTLAHISGRTDRVRLGIAVLVLPLRNPVVVAKQLANLDVLSGGRLILGVAPGAPKITMPEFDAVGVSYGERGRITDEYIEALRRLWDEPLPSYSGRYISFTEVQLFPKPLQKRLGILIGGGERGISERALRRVVERGDGWIPAYLTPDEIADGAAKISKEAQRAGRDSSGFTISHELFACVNADSSTAKQRAAKTLSTNFESIAEGEKRSLVGTPREIAERLDGYAAAGAQMTELKFIYSDIEVLLSMMQVFSRDVIRSM